MAGLAELAKFGFTSVNGWITLNGSGTFQVPAGVVTGGGVWTTFDPTGKSTGGGTYAVTQLVSWHQAPGTFPDPLFGAAVTDNVGNLSDFRAGLAIFTIQYSDGSDGVLLVSCEVDALSTGIFTTGLEGIIVTKGYVIYWDGNPKLSPGNPHGAIAIHLLR